MEEEQKEEWSAECGGGLGKRSCPKRSGEKREDERYLSQLVRVRHMDLDGLRYLGLNKFNPPNKLIAIYSIELEQKN